MSRITNTLLFALALAGLAGCGVQAGENGLSFVFAQREADTTFGWSGQIVDGQWLEIKGVNGAVNATPASGGTAEVTAVRTGRRSDPNEVEIVVVEHDDGVTICAVYPSRGDRPNECVPGSGGRNSTRRNDVKVDFEVAVPDGVRFAGRMVNGAVRADGLDGDVLARTVNGGIRLSTSQRATARTVNGSIEAAFGGSTLAGETEFETVNGSITLDVSDTLDADLRIRTTNGRIRADVPMVATRTSRRRVEGTLGNGGATLSLRTVNGSVTVE